MGKDNMIKHTSTKLAVMALVLGLVSGCATTDQMKQMQAGIDQAQERADAALAAAKAADSRASAAMDAATAAQNQADDCSERCNRIMSKAMSK
ncbi:MAG: gamma-glutamyltranspeptidase [Gammaproteobacteria bacterium]|nr:gamma-glutamyltranspeptidase [Gammaproteobacteria bacterium]